MSPDPLPPDDSDLEELMSRHLDYVRPDPELRDAALGQLRGALSGAARPKRRSGKGRGSSFSPLIPATVLSCGLLICVGVVLSWSRTQAPPPPNEPALWSRAKGLEEEGMSAYHAFVQGRRAGLSAAEQSRLRNRAIEQLGAAVEQMNAVLDPKRDEAGNLPPEFEGYEEDLSRIATYLVDLEKLSPLTPRDGR